jgi:antitoxin (DNA-binding transcriptional repressor) of toxin-antitoxin stability system
MVVTAKQLRLRTSEILKKVQRVGTVTVTLRDNPVAKLLALNKERPGRLADDPAVGMWADREEMKDVHAWLRKIRRPRYDRLGRRISKV